MSESELLCQIDNLLRGIAREVASAVDARTAEWDRITVSVKWADVVSGICDIIIASTHGTRETYHLPPRGVYHALTELGEVKRQLVRPWDELLIGIGPDGACKVEFGYPD